MARGKNQKLKLFYLYKFMHEETDRTHHLTMTQIIERLGSYGVEADRKSLYDDIKALDLFGIQIKTYYLDLLCKSHGNGHTHIAKAYQ